MSCDAEVRGGESVDKKENPHRQGEDLKKEVKRLKTVCLVMSMTTVLLSIGQWFLFLYVSRLSGIVGGLSNTVGSILSNVNELVQALEKLIEAVL